MNASKYDVDAPCDVLLVDDNERNGGPLATAMENRGYKVTVCHSACEALRAVNTFRPRHVVTELKLPDENGLELVSQLRKAVPATNVIVLTRYASIATAVEAIKRGASNYLIKPASTDQIVTALSRHQSKHRAAAAASAPTAISIERLEWEYINWVLQESDGNLSAAARALSMHRRTLQRKLSKRAPHR